MSSINQYNNRYSDYQSNQAKYMPQNVQSSSTVNTSNIDQHKNNIQQRIANLQAKLMKKTNNNGANQIQQPYKQTYKDSIMQKYQIQPYNYKPQANVSEQVNLNYPYSRYNIKSPNLPYKFNDVGFHSLQPTYTQNYKTNYSQALDQVALRQRRFSNSNINLPYQTKQNKTYQSRQNQQLNKIISKKSTSRSPRSIDKIAKNPQNNKYLKSQNNGFQNIKMNNNIQNYQKNMNRSGISQTSQIKKQTSQSSYNRKANVAIIQTKKTMPLLQKKHNRQIDNIQSDFLNLNKTISNLRNYGKQINPMQTQINDLSSSYSRLNNTIAVNSSNNNGLKNSNQQLYEMMKSILIGQQKLQKQLHQLKNKSTPAQTFRNQNFTKNTERNKEIQRKSQLVKYNQNKKSNHVSPKKAQTSQNIYRSRSKSAKKTKQIHSNSPVPHSSDISQFVKKSPVNITNKQQINFEQNKKLIQNNQNISGRTSSAVNKRPSIGKGKITKNKSKFDELYQLALKSKKLNSENKRIILEENTLTSIWCKIQKVINRTQKQNLQTSTVYHENNRYTNDHLINTIQLQKKLQNDLVKKVYDMCQNKCVYK